MHVLNLAHNEPLRFDQQKSLVTDQKNSTNQSVLKKTSKIQILRFFVGGWVGGGWVGGWVGGEK